MTQTKFEEQLAKRRAAKEQERKSVGDELIAMYGMGDRESAGGWYKGSPAKAKATEPEPPDFAKLDIPQLPEYERSQSDQRLDAIIDALPITTAYKRWIKKGEPERRWDGQTESIKLRCPFPHHVDTHPSAWCNTDKNVWYCDPCDYGGDVYDLAAIHFGYPCPDYKKSPEKFVALRADIARDFGIQIVKGLNGKEYAVGPEDGPTALPSREPAAVPAPRQSNGNGVHKGFQIPGVKSVTVTMPGQAGPPTQAAPTVKMTPPSPPLQAAPPTQAAPVAPPVQPAPAPAPSVPAPPQPPSVKEKAEPKPEPAQPAAPQEVHKGFQIPGVQSITIPSGSPLASVPAPTGLVTPPKQKLEVQEHEIITPTEDLLKKYGLTATGDDSGGSSYSGISLDWRSITPPDTFLGKYMAHFAVDDVPEEFHYFSGLGALSLATGRDLRLKDKRPVLANIFVCLMGRTGDGKSDAKGYATELIRQAMPFVEDDPGNKGVKRVANPASGEYMVKEFEKSLKDPLTNQVIGQAPVRGIIDFEEFATIMTRASNKGSSLAQFMIEFFDGKVEIGTGSLTNNKATAREPFATTFSSVQPEVMSSLVTDNHMRNGFLNRWLFVAGREKSWVPLGGEVLEVEPMVSPLQKAFSWAIMEGAGGKLVEWEAPAFRLAYDFLMEVILPAKKADRSGATARIDLMYKKMILLQTVNMRRMKVPPEAVQIANEMYKYFVLTYGVLDDAVNQSEDQELRQDIMRAILSLHQKNGRPPSPTQISDRLGSRKYTLERIIRCLQVMEKMGHIEELPPVKGPGRPTVRYQIVSG